MKTIMRRTRLLLLGVTVSVYGACSGGEAIDILNAATASASGGGFGDGGGGDASSGSGFVCVPGIQVACACPGGLNGVQICSANGDGFGPCECATNSPGSGGSGSASSGGAGGAGGSGGSAACEPAAHDCSGAIWNGSSYPMAIQCSGGSAPDGNCLDINANGGWCCGGAPVECVPTGDPLPCNNAYWCGSPYPDQEKCWKQHADADCIKVNNYLCCGGPASPPVCCALAKGDVACVDNYPPNPWGCMKGLGAPPVAGCQVYSTQNNVTFYCCP